MIVISAILRAKEGKADELVALMKDLVKAVKENEPGALEYALHRSKKDPDLFMIYEKYKDGDAMNAHMTAPHFQDAAGKMKDILEGGLGVEIYDLVE